MAEDRFAVPMPQNPSSLTLRQCRALAKVEGVPARLGCTQTPDGLVWERLGGWLLALDPDNRAKHCLGSLPWVVMLICTDPEDGIEYVALGADKMACAV